MGNRLAVALPVQLNDDAELDRAIRELLQHVQKEITFCDAVLKPATASLSQTPSDAFKAAFGTGADVQGRITQYRQVLAECEVDLQSLQVVANMDLEFLKELKSRNNIEGRCRNVIRRSRFYDFYLCYFALAANSLGSTFMKGITEINTIMEGYINGMKAKMAAAIENGIKLVEELVELLEKQHDSIPGFDALIATVQRTVTGMQAAYDELQSQQAALRERAVMQGGAGLADALAPLAPPATQPFAARVPQPLPSSPPVIPANTEMEKKEEAVKERVKKLMNTVKVKHEVFEATNREFGAFVETMLRVLKQYMGFIDKGMGLFEAQQGQSQAGQDMFVKTLQELEKQPGLDLRPDFTDYVTNHFANAGVMFSSYNAKWTELKEKLLRLASDMNASTGSVAPRAAPPTLPIIPPSSGPTTWPSLSSPSTSASSIAQAGVNATTFSSVVGRSPVSTNLRGPEGFRPPTSGLGNGPSQQAFQTLTGFTNTPPG